MHSFLDFNGFRAFAHRGGAEEAPENTMAAFEHAYDAGLRYMETDVHRTRDGVLVAFHDRNLRRLAGRDALISEGFVKRDANKEAYGKLLQDANKLQESANHLYSASKFLNISAK